MHSLVCVYVFYQAEHLYHPLEAGSQRLTAPCYHSSPNSWNIPQPLLFPGKNTQKCVPTVKLQLECLCKQMSENDPTWLTEKQQKLN